MFEPRISKTAACESSRAVVTPKKQQHIGQLIRDVQATDNSCLLSVKCCHYK